MLGFHITALGFMVIGGLCALVGEFVQDWIKGVGFMLMLAAIAAEIVFGIGLLITPLLH